MSFDKLRNKSLVAPVLNYTLLVQKAEYRVNRFSRTDYVDLVGRACVNRKRLGFPELPVLVERCRVIRTGVSAINIRQPEVLGKLDVLKARLHYPDVRYVIALHIKARELNAELIGAYVLKHSGSNSLSRFSEVVSREHAVDVGVVGRPEALADIH